MYTEDIIFFTIASLVVGGFVWMVIWAIGKSTTTLHDLQTYQADAASKVRGLSSDFFSPEIKQPPWLSRLPHLRDVKYGRSLFLVSTSEIVIHAKARFFWEIVSPGGPYSPYVVLRPFQVIKFTDINNYTYTNEGVDGWTLRFNLNDGDSKVYTHCANNSAFLQTLEFFKQEIGRNS